MSVLEERTVEVAAALAKHARQGRDLRWTVLAWYAKAGLPQLPGRLTIPEPPWSAVREALLWAEARSPVQRLLDQARQARTDAAQDDFYASADRVLSRTSGGLPDPNQTRQALLTDTDLPRSRWAGRARLLVHVIAASGIGAEELGGQAVAAALAAWMPGLPAYADPKVWAEALEQAERDGLLAEWLASLESFDPLARLAKASEAEMARAREVALRLAGFGGFYVMYGLLMPDTPALAALRQGMDDTGMGEWLQLMCAVMVRPQNIYQFLAPCLDEDMAALNTHLENLIVDQGARLFLRPGHPDDTAQYMRDWIAAIEALANAPSGPAGSTDDAS
ncbi:hypothetical protein [Streptomyces sp. KMM 9044]|uniref:hypothetical protein n=1 Tax=Streptomyces sp. KMM 9044 TaxID=2744474 RepID=UPI0021510DD9|nr:hypothetical protein [Streptomyces sp. KMM 9044]WAX78774.1 hypothetical protein HUV60_014870 [Streptomyces sp. KMM 9044]